MASGSSMSEAMKTAASPSSIADKNNSTATDAVGVSSNEKSPQAPAADPKEESLRHQFAVLNKKERALQNLANDLKAEREEIQKLREEWKAMEADPFNWMEKKGHTYENWTKRILNDGKPTPEMEMKSLKQELEARVKQQEEELKRLKDEQTQRQIDHYRHGLVSHIQSNAEKYEALQLKGEAGANTVYELIVEDIVNQKRAGVRDPELRVMTYEEACQKVEDYLIEDARPFTKLKKLQNLLEPKKEETDSSSSAEGNEESPTSNKEPSIETTILSQSGQQSQRPRTLTNQMEAQIPNNRKERSTMTREERLREAAKLLVWK